MSTRPDRRSAALTLVHVTTVPESLMFLRGQPRHFTKLGYAVHAVSSPGPDLARFAELERIPVHAFEMPRRITPFADLRTVLAIAKLFRRLAPDVVHAHTPKGGLLGMMAARLAGVRRRINHVHGLPFLTRSGWKRRLLMTTERISSALATDVLCVSRGVADVLAAERICPAERIRVLASGSINGVDSERFQPVAPAARAAAKSALGFPESSRVIGFVGRLAVDKGVRELADAWRSLRARHPDLRLLMVGPDEPGDPVPVEYMDALRRDERVRLHGMDWNTPPLYAAMDIVTLPSYREGLPSVPLEAAAMGLPVVACDVPGSRDAVVHGVTGTLISPRDTAALMQALERYLLDTGLTAEHGRNGRARALEVFSQRRILDELAVVYEGGGARE